MLVFQKNQRSLVSEYLERSIFAARPLFKKILQEHETDTLSEFSYKNLQASGKPDEKRKKEFLKIVEKLLLKRLGPVVASEVKAQLDRYFVACTADHHGTINSSLALSGDLLLASGYPQCNDPVLKYIFVLSCASISLNNEDYPRGLLFHSYSNGTYNLQKLSLLPSNSHSSLVYGYRPYTTQEVAKIEKVLKENLKQGNVSEKEGTHISNILNSIYRREDILKVETLCEQFTKINFSLWRELFHHAPSVKDLVYLELEELVAQLLIVYHMEGKTPLHEIIFNKEKSEKLIPPLTAAMEEFLRQGYIGTHLFWGISGKNQRVRLELKEGDTLVSHDGSFSLPLRPGTVKDALEKRCIMPNLLLAYTVVHLYYSFNCIGGFNQIHYLKKMQEVYNTNGVDDVLSTANSTLYGYGMNLLFLENRGKYTPAHALDILLHGSSNTWEEISQQLNKTTFADTFWKNVSVITNVLSK